MKAVDSTRHRHTTRRLAHLGDGIRSLKEDLPPQQLCQDTPNGPHINGSVIVPASRKELRCTIELCHHLQRHSRTLVGLNCSCKPKVTDPQVRVAVDQHIARLDIPVDDTS